MKPENIPSAPYSVYKNKGWKSFGDWLGTGVVASSKKSYLSFEEARSFVHKLKLESEKDWKEYCKSGKKPENIPNTPRDVYLDKGWKGSGDWLGTGKIAFKNKVFLPFKEARTFIHKLKLKNVTEWEEYCKSGKKPNDIPTNPRTTYKLQGWKGLGDWLGTGAIASRDREFRTYKNARKFAHSLKLKSRREWENYCKIGKIPVDIPRNPARFYKNKGWISWGDWLGYEK